MDKGDKRRSGWWENARRRRERRTECRPLSQKHSEGRGRAQAKRRTGSDKTGRSGLHVKLHYSATHPASYSGRWRPTEKQTENANINSKPTLSLLAVWVSMPPLANNHQNYKLDKCQRAIDLGTATSPAHATFKNGTLCPQLCASSCEATTLSALRLVRPQ